MRWTILAALLAGQLAAAELKPATSDAFDRYIKQTEARLDSRKNFLWADESAERAQRVRQGMILVEPTGAKAITDVPDGLVHDWIGAIFIPGATLKSTLALAQNYNQHKDFYKPEVVSSRILSHNDNDFRIFMRLLKKQVITVVLDTEHDVHYIPIDSTRWRSNSRTLKIAEVEKAGTPSEHELPPGTGHGFLWRLNSYWRFEERDGGTWVECEAVSLSRNIPTGLGWIIQPIIHNLPRTSLENTLRATRTALAR